MGLIDQKSELARLGSLSSFGYSKEEEEEEARNQRKERIRGFTRGNTSSVPNVFRSRSNKIKQEDEKQKEGFNLKKGGKLSLSKAFKEVANVAKEVPGAIREVLYDKPAKFSKQMFFEEPARLGAGALMEAEERLGVGGKGREIEPKTWAEKFVFGEKTVKTLGKQGKEFLSDIGMDKETAEKYGLPLSTAFLGLELTGTGKLVKKGAKVAKGAKAGIMESFVKAKDIKEVFSIADTNKMNLDMKDVKSLTEAKSTKEVQDIVGETLDKQALASKAEKAVDEKKIIDIEKKQLPEKPKEVVEKVKEGVEVVKKEDIVKQVAKKADEPLVSKITKAGEKVLKPTLVSKAEVPKIGGQIGKQALGDSKGIRGVPTDSIVENSVSALKGDIKKLDTATSFNVDKLNISKQGKQVIDNTLIKVKPSTEKLIGKKLSNSEMVEMANKTQKVMTRAIGRDETLKWQSAMLNTRKQLARQAETGVVDKMFIDNLLIVKTRGTDIARKLQSLSKAADPADNNMQAILQAVLNATDNADDVLKASKGVDFNDLNQASEFYRKFVKPSKSEWIDLIRYNSMLSSPLTHIINITSNLLNTSIVAPIEKTLTGALDFLGTTISGKKRSYYAGEGAQHLKGYLKNVPAAFDRFSDVMAGKIGFSHLDIQHMPVATKGVKGKIAKTLSFPLRLLEGMDQFFMALGESGEKASLLYRRKKGVKVTNLDIKAQKDAMYRLFRQELFPENQGMILDVVDTFTSTIFSWRNSKNPIVSNISKFTSPFLKTPMNYFKQGVEYSPLGFATLYGAKNKTKQLSKAIIGSSVFAGAATLYESDKLTFEEPVGENQKNEFRRQGKQAYSIKLGDSWVSYQKLPPALAFPIAMVACLSEAKKNKKVDDTFINHTLSAVAKFGSFLADQSYAKSFGDLLTASRRGEAGVAKLVSNYPQQLIPMRAFSGWLARTIDEYQRKPDRDTNIIEKQVQYLMMQIPGVSQKVPARKDIIGESIESQNNIINAFSPFKISTEEPRTKEKIEAFKRDAKKRMMELYASGTPADRRKVTSIQKHITEEELGLTDKEKKFNNLSVYDGKRAKSIYAYTKNMNKKEQKDIIFKLMQVGAISDDVLTQIYQLQRGRSLDSIE